MITHGTIFCLQAYVGHCVLPYRKDGDIIVYGCICLYFGKIMLTLLLFMYILSFCLALSWMYERKCSLEKPEMRVKSVNPKTFLFSLTEYPDPGNYIHLGYISFILYLTEEGRLTKHLFINPRTTLRKGYSPIYLIQNTMIMVQTMPHWHILDTGWNTVWCSLTQLACDSAPSLLHWADPNIHPLNVYSTRELLTQWTTVGSSYDLLGCLWKQA